MVLKITGSIFLFLIVFAMSILISIFWTFQKPAGLIKVTWDEQTGSIYQNLIYENEYSNCYDLYVPSNLDTSQEQALILYIHGGGFTGGSKSSGEAWCKYLASKGYITASMDYTVSNQNHVSDINRMNQEVNSCVDAIYKKCRELGFEINQMATTGESAGGCLAMLYAYSQPTDAAIPVKFVFQMTGPAHFDPFAWGSKEGDWESAAGFVTMMTGKEITAEMMESGEGQRYIDEISPASYVDEDTVPTLCAYGPKDKVVPVGIKFKLFEALERYGVTYDYIEYSHSNHGMYSDLNKHEEYIAKVLEYCEKYFEN